MFLIWCTYGITGSTYRGCGIYDNLESLGKIIRSSGTSVSNLETRAEPNDPEQQAGCRQHDYSSAYERKT